MLKCMLCIFLVKVCEMGFVGILMLKVLLMVMGIVVGGLLILCVKVFLS